MTTCTFEIKTYNGISIIINKDDGYVNASQMCSSNNKKWRNYKNTKMWKQVENAFIRLFSEGAQKWTPSYYIEKAAPKYQGEYIHPKLVHFVAEYCSVDYAFMVAEIMDSVNDKVHEVLEKNELPDTPENANPAFVEVVKQIAPSVDIGLINKQCWGYRERFHELDQWEQDDLRRDVNEYEEMKKRIDELEKKVNKLGSYVKQYCPEFVKIDEK